MFGICKGLANGKNFCIHHIGSMPPGCFTLPCAPERKVMNRGTFIQDLKTYDKERDLLMAFSGRLEETAQDSISKKIDSGCASLLRVSPNFLKGPL